eukprot:TRINITY_DN1572_c0_g1_i3.p1 TRINITY_DN1572_c0_g1~~TRINITY_DN1572_c0_g1_i3.p1  ORF type:complete len:101 (+),score=15.58 TRINITY_DN1572_c0_g1_i3:28-303(+)
MSSLDLQPLTAVTSTTDTAIHESMWIASSLCVLSKTDKINRLVIQNESFGECSDKNFIKVKQVTANEIIEVEREYVKILEDPDNSDMDIDM